MSENGCTNVKSDTDAFWQAFRRNAGLDQDNYLLGSFGDSPGDGDQMADLVVAGIKKGYG